MKKAEEQELKLGKYDVSRNSDGSYNIHRVPIFAVVDKDSKKYDEGWLEEAVRNFRAQKEETGYLPPLIVGHNQNQGEEREAVGLLDALVRRGKRLFADLVRIPAEVFEKIKRGAWPARSVETWHVQKRITALALLGGSVPVHKFHPIHFSEEAPEGELDWVSFELSDDADHVYRPISEHSTEKEGEKKMAEEKTQLFTEEQEIALEAVVAERVRESLADAEKERQQFAARAKELQTQVEKYKDEAETARRVLSEREQVELKASIERFGESLRLGTEKMRDPQTGVRYGLNAGFLDEAGLERFMEVLAADTERQKFSEKQEQESTKLDQFKSMISVLVELAAQGRLLVPQGEAAPAGEQTHSFAGGAESGQMKDSDPDSAELDRAIHDVARERGINLAEDKHGTAYAQLFHEIGRAREKAAE